jgi:hypothetical protein
VPIDTDDEWSWDLNDYTDPTMFTGAVFCLWGWHDIPEPDALGNTHIFCVALVATVVGNMLMVHR